MMGLFDIFKKKPIEDSANPAVGSPLKETAGTPPSLHNNLDVCFEEGMFCFIDCPLDEAVQRVVKLVGLPVTAQLPGGAVQVGSFVAGGLAKWTVLVSHAPNEDEWDNRNDAEDFFLNLAKENETIYARYNEEQITCYFIALKNGKITRLFSNDFDFPDLNKNDGHTSIDAINKMDSLSSVTSVIMEIIKGNIETIDEVSA
ncbi:hypothetical protein LJC61_01140 [Ruminococcaceae bacterium OttesenSCG-928-A16]|nr:hypothetical protein [Ruminococcaceae bacterium OttesenSCG-928-A16]